jgi:hypothetical protein
MATDDNDKRVKDMLGTTSAADLQRWFGLPSYTALEEEGKTASLPDDDPYKEAREQRDRALAAVEPRFLAAIHERHEKPWTLLRFEQTIDVKVRVDMGLFDESMATTRATAEPREIERPEDIEDDLKDSTPQALLRDLHRSEKSFDIQYEIYDAGDTNPFSGSHDAAEMMGTNLRQTLAEDLPGTDLRAMMGEIIHEWRQPWAELPKRNRMVNRRIKE